MLSIGEFSKICMVSVKALRHYDKIGLLHPVEINPDTGYRYYSQDQIPRMVLINRLKGFGFSLSDIKAMLFSDDVQYFTKMLIKQRQILHNAVSSTRMTIDDLDSYLAVIERTGNIMSYQNNYDVITTHTEDMAVISTRQMMSVDEFGKYYGTLYKRCADEDIVLDGRCMAMYHDREFDPERSDIELLLGVQDAAKADKTVKGCLCAVTTHFGGYSKLPEAYGSITEWIEKNGYKIAAPPYEIYVKTQFDKLPVAKWETRIYFPIEKI